MPIGDKVQAFLYVGFFYSKMNRLKLMVSINAGEEKLIILRPVVQRQLFAFAAYNEMSVRDFIERCMTFAVNDSDSVEVPEEEMTYNVPSDWCETYSSMRTEADYKRFMSALSNDGNHPGKEKQP